MEELVPRRERLKRRARANRVRKVVFSVFSCFVAIFVIIWTVRTAERLINWHSMQLVPVSYGVLEDITEKKAVVIRKEIVFSVPQPENVKFLVRETERVHAGAMVFKINSPEIQRTEKITSYKMYAPCSGTFSLKVDGLESVLNPGSFMSLDLDSVYEKVTKGTMEGQRDHGKSAIKIVDNLSPAYLCFPGSEMKLKKNSDILFRISGSKELFSGQIINEPQDITIISLPGVPKELIGERVSTIRLITRRKYGLIVPTSSLVKKDGETGLYAISGNNVHWIKVTVEGVFKKNAVVEGVKLGQEIVANPETI